MAIEMILAPVKDDLKIIEEMINEFIAQIQQEKIRDNYRTFFKARGKYLRPSLLMLAAGATSGDRRCFDKGLYRLGLILELLHSASLIHDDIVDGDLERRGEKTVNRVFGNKVAVLAGDMLFSYAFREATLYYEKEFTVPITKLALSMCTAELEQANQVDSLEGYLRVIGGKTAEFMAVACGLGAKYAGGEEEQVDLMRKIGLNIGMTYQMVDDLVDKDPNGIRFISKETIDQHFEKTNKLITGLKPSVYTTSLGMLLGSVMKMMR